MTPNGLPGKHKFIGHYFLLRRLSRKAFSGGSDAPVDVELIAESDIPWRTYGPSAFMPLTRLLMPYLAFFTPALTILLQIEGFFRFGWFNWVIVKASSQILPYATHIPLAVHLRILVDSVYGDTWSNYVFSNYLIVWTSLMLASATVIVSSLFEMSFNFGIVNEVLIFVKKSKNKSAYGNFFPIIIMFLGDIYVLFFDNGIFPLGFLFNGRVITGVGAEIVLTIIEQLMLAGLSLVVIMNFSVLLYAVRKLVFCFLNSRMSMIRR